MTSLLCSKYFPKDCLHKQIFVYNLLQSPLNFHILISLILIFSYFELLIRSKWGGFLSLSFLTFGLDEKKIIGNYSNFFALFFPKQQNMELLSTFSSINPQNFTLQKFLIVFPQKKNTLRRFLIFSEMQPWTFRSELEKIPKSTLHFLHFRTCNILALILKSLKEKKP